MGPPGLAGSTGPQGLPGSDGPPGPPGSSISATESYGFERLTATSPVIAGGIVPFVPVLASPDVIATPGTFEAVTPGVYEVEYDLSFSTAVGGDGFLFHILFDGGTVVTTSSVGHSLTGPITEHVSGVALVALDIGDTVSVQNDLANGTISAFFGQFVMHRVADLPPVGP